MKKAIKYIDKPLLFTTIVLFIFGLVMVFSASNVTAYMSHAVSPYNYFLKQAAFLLFGLFSFFIVIKFSQKSYGIFSWLAMLLGIASLIGLFILSQAKNQAVSWYDLGPISIQPSEFIKIITIVWLASYYDKNKNKLNRYSKVLFPMGICAIVAFLIFLQPDLGTMLIYIAIVGVIYYAIPMNRAIKTKTIIGGLGAIAILGILMFSGTITQDRQTNRISEMRNPCDKILDTGNQVCNCYIAINNGGLFGVGLGNSTQKYLYLPEPYTDFIYAIIVEELGVVTGVTLVLAYMFILYRILLIGRKSKTNKGATICYGVAAYIFFHIIVNLMGIMGMIPMTGVPLPFMSYGGSFTICLVIALSLVQKISIDNGESEERE